MLHVLRAEHLSSPLNILRHQLHRNEDHMICGCSTCARLAEALQLCDIKFALNVAGDVISCSGNSHHPSGVSKELRSHCSNAPDFAFKSR